MCSSDLAYLSGSGGGSGAGGGGYGGIRHKYDDDDEIKERIKKIQQEEDELIINFVKAFMQHLNYN